MNLPSRRTIPNTSLEVSPLCLGTMTFGAPVAEADAIRLTHWALDHGINFIDTADIYEGYNRFLGSPGGVAETILGKALQGRRAQAVVTTKVGNPVGTTEKGLSRTHILRQIGSSLKRLRTDYVDIYELHRPDPKTALSESMAVMAELIAAGKVRHRGFSNFAAAHIHEMISLCDAPHWPRPVVSQPPYSWLKRDIEAEDLPACRKYHIAITPYQPLQGGLLSGKYRRGQPLPAGSRAAENPKWLAVPDETTHARLELFESEAKQAGLTPSQHAVRWLLDQPGVTTSWWESNESNNWRNSARERSGSTSVTSSARVSNLSKHESKHHP